MARGTKHTVTVNGKEHTRTSPRTYTHVVLVRHSIDHDRKEVNRPRSKTDISNFNYYAEVAAKPATTERDEAYRAQCAEATKDGIDAYFTGLQERGLARIAKREAEGYYAEWTPYSWSMTERNAVKAASTQSGKSYWAGVKVVPVGSVIELPV